VALVLSGLTGTWVKSIPFLVKKTAGFSNVWACRIAVQFNISHLTPFHSEQDINQLTQIKPSIGQLPFFYECSFALNTPLENVGFTVFLVIFTRMM